MQVAVAQRQEQMPVEPAGLALFDGDYVYSEYLSKNCLADNNPFIHSELKCGSDGAVNPARLKEALDAAQEREQILKLFSSED